MEEKKDVRILIIEDNEIDLLLATRYLTRAGYSQITNAGDVSQGVKRAVEDKPDLVISDTVLPDSDGFDACSQIRKVLGEQKPKIIITTGSVDAVDAVRARKAGADDYCAKTSDCALLLEAVKKLV
ncbi:MAG: response regulator [Candidatus Omnitrophica bacterium]|nr:response regulator [Candidatus Omnitrophota bacterium]